MSNGFGRHVDLKAPRYPVFGTVSNGTTMIYESLKMMCLSMKWLEPNEQPHVKFHYVDGG